jgi:CheY-like chemotaxis protein
MKPDSSGAQGHLMPHKALQGVRLLLAEDFDDNQILISRGLRHLGADVDVVSDGREAVDRALKRDYDVILMDIQMPGMDGIEATRILREKHYETPIIALTAHAMKEEKERILSCGFDDYVVKPLDRKALVHAIRKAAHLGT